MLHVLDLFGVAVFAVSGALVAGRNRMDVFGVIVVALVTAIGGGTVRDLILDYPPFWVAAPVYLYVGAAAGLATFFLARFVTLSERPLLWADAAGLGVFTVIGCQKAFDLHVGFAPALVMGVMTAVMGGMLRDVLCNQTPLIMRREVYATASLIGGVVYLLARRWGADAVTAATLGAVTVFLVRAAALRWNLALPVFREHLDPKETSHGADNDVA